jgi:rhomboid protease GluP
MTFFWRAVAGALRTGIAALEALGARGPRWEWKKQAWSRAVEARIASWENLERGVRARFRMCPACRSLVESSASSCPACGASLRGVPRGGPGRLVALLLPGTASLSMVLVTINVLMSLAALALWGIEADRGGPLGLLAPRGEALFALGGKWAPSIREGEVWRLVTAGYLHGGLLHLAINCYALSSLGPLIEQSFGARRLLIIYTATGVVAFAASALLRPDVHSVGASGSLFGLLGFAAIYGRFRGGAAGRAIADQLMRWVIVGLMLVLVPGIDTAAHVGGLAAGALLGLLLSPGEPRGRMADLGLRIAAAACALATAVAFLAMAIAYPANAEAMRRLGRAASPFVEPVEISFYIPCGWTRPPAAGEAAPRGLAGAGPGEPREAARPTSRDPYGFLR